MQDHSMLRPATNSNEKERAEVIGELPEVGLGTAVSNGTVVVKDEVGTPEGLV